MGLACEHRGGRAAQRKPPLGKLLRRHKEVAVYISKDGNIAAVHRIDEDASDKRFGYTGFGSSRPLGCRTRRISSTRGRCRPANGEADEQGETLSRRDD